MKTTHIEYQTGFMSKHEESSGGKTRSDYRTAHHRAGDPDYQKWIPEACTACRKQELTAEEAGFPTPSRPDQEVRHDPA